jgi:rubrerythrin
MNQNFRLIFIFVILLGLICCSKSKSQKSLEGLLEAYKSELISAEKFTKYAMAARSDGLDTLSHLLVAIAQSDSIHAANHARVLEKFGKDHDTNEKIDIEVKATPENLKVLLKEKSFSMQSAYPGFIKRAEQEKIPEAASSLTWAYNVEKKQLQYLRMATLIISKGNEKKIPLVWLICPNCGDIYSQSDLKTKCELCLTPQENFSGYKNPTE